MAVSEKNAVVKASSDIQTDLLTIKGVFDSEDTKSWKNKDGETQTIKLPYRIKIEDEQGNIVSESSSQKTLTTQDWFKKFYQNDKGYWNYTRDQVLLAIIKVLQAGGHVAVESIEKTGEFNINKLEGIQFNGVVAKAGNGNRFIDWYRTFQANGVEVPRNNVTNNDDSTGSNEPQADNSSVVEAMFDAKDFEGVKLFVKDADGDFAVATEEQRNDTKMQLFKKDGREYIDIKTGLPF